MNNKSILITGGGGFIGSHLVKELLKEDIEEVIIYDNLTRGKIENVEGSLKDSRCHIFPSGGDIRDIDILNEAMQGIEMGTLEEGQLLQTRGW